MNLMYPALVIFNTCHTLASSIKESLLRTFDDAAYYFFGYSNLWAFFDNEHNPVQIRYIRPQYLNKVDFFYNDIYHVWYTSYYNPIVKRLPWITATLTVGEEKYDLTEFMMNQKIQINCIRPIYPAPDMLVAAWCLEEGVSFSFDERCNATLTVMNDECEEFTLGLIVNSDDEVDLFGKSIGIENYSGSVEEDAWGGESDVAITSEVESGATSDATSESKKID